MFMLQNQHGQSPHRFLPQVGWNMCLSNWVQSASTSQWSQRVGFWLGSGVWADSRWLHRGHSESWTHTLSVWPILSSRNHHLDFWGGWLCSRLEVTHIETREVVENDVGITGGGHAHLHVGGWARALLKSKAGLCAKGIASAMKMFSVTSCANTEQKKDNLLWLQQYFWSACRMCTGKRHTPREVLRFTLWISKSQWSSGFVLRTTCTGAR